MKMIPKNGITVFIPDNKDGVAGRHNFTVVVEPNTSGVARTAIFNFTIAGKTVTYQVNQAAV